MHLLVWIWDYTTFPELQIGRFFFKREKKKEKYTILERPVKLLSKKLEATV